MAKRQHVADSDEEGSDQQQLPTPSSKRARTADSDEEDVQSRRGTQCGARSNGRSAKGKGKARARDEEDDDGGGSDDSEEAEAADEQMDDEEFENKYGDQLRNLLESRRKQAGGVADHGIIEHIEMHQFMCHKFLSFKFGPQINFIIGHNGSGKSAVLSAITVALGGKATSTGRGNGLKSFIREGQSVSEVTITIKNQGEEAFKSKEYGDSIIITRRFSKEGSSSWKIKSKDQRVISTKKDELSAICDHMNIQVDNPMNVLTQDSARQFLSASAPGDKYKFFLKGTQLSQLSDEYELCLDNITNTAKILAVKKEALPDLKGKFREQTMRYEEAAKAREQKKKADDLKKELAWSHVAAKEGEMTKKMEESAKMARRLPKIEESLKQAQAIVETTSTQVAEYEAEVDGLESVQHLATRKDTLQNEMRENRKTLATLGNDIKQINNGMSAVTNQIEGISSQIAEEERKLAEDSQDKREKLQAKLTAARDAVGNAETRVQDIIAERKNLGIQADNMNLEGKGLDRPLKEAKGKITECDQMMESARRREKDALVPYGREIKRVLEKIKQMRWEGDVPLGPLGTHVKAKDPQKWGDLLRNQLGNYLTAFAVTNARDRGPLKKLLVETGNNHVLIVIYEKDMFDYRQGEPAEHLLTVLRALEISDPYVLRILINQAGIERQILADTRREAQQTLQGIRGGGSAWSLDKFAVRVFPEGGVSSSPLMFRKQNDAMSLLLTGRDSAADIRHWSAVKAQTEIEYRDINEKVSNLKKQYMDLRRAIDGLNNQERQAGDVLRSAKMKVSDLQQEANEDLPVNMAGLQSMREEAEDEKQNLKSQFEEIHTRKKGIDDANRELLNQINDVKELLGEHEGKRLVIQKKTEAAVAERVQAQNNVKHYEKKHAEEKQKVDVVEEAVGVLQLEFQEWTKKASEYCDQIPNPRKVQEVERHLNSVQMALKEREKRHGASVEEMAKEVNKAKEQLQKAERELKQMSVLNRALKQSLLTRLARWQEFRRHIALRCKLVFAYHLSQRGYYGKILFNHDVSTLMLRVQTDDQIQTQGSKEKDPRSLSGGEKSFSTICLLLSLWESIGCPLRCLDEFDVFMDAINRRISMKMMIDTANTSDKKQYILITPQDMTNLTIGPTVRVLRMTDPERGNGLLPFGGGGGN